MIVEAGVGRDLQFKLAGWRQGILSIDLSALHADAPGGGDRHTLYKGFRKTDEEIL